MSVLVDDAVWPWHGDRWAHLATDASVDELHAFANDLGVRRLAFQDDHYDVPSAVRDAAVARGAIPVTSRALVAALRASGLRVRGRRVRWRDADRLDPVVVGALDAVHAHWPHARDVLWTTCLRRPREVALSAVLVAGHPLADVEVPAAFARSAFIVGRPEGRVLDIVVSLTVA